MSVGAGLARARQHRAARPLVLMAAGVAIAVVFSLWAGSGSPGGRTSAAPPTPGPVQAMAVDQLASQLGCDAKPTTNGRVSGFQHTYCHVSGTRYTITTFTTAENQRAWLAEADGSGGMFLLGKQWVVASETAGALFPLSTKIGGRLVSGDDLV